MKIRLFIFSVTAVTLISMSSSRKSAIRGRQQDNRGNCTTTDDCHIFEKCKNEKCIDACKFITCGENAWCDVRNHVAHCTCTAKYIGDPTTGCSRQNCTTTGDCYTFEKCENNHCINVCNPSPCGKNAWCTTNNHIAVCTCSPELTGDPFTECVEKNCTNNSDCTELQKCENNKCIDACESVSCGEHAWCNVANHAPICECMHRYIGNPDTGCVEQNCTVSTDCDEFDSCKDNKCIDPCEHVLCGENAWCDVHDHIAICTCMDRHNGDPYTKCIRENCTIDRDCFETERCENENCIDACESVVCGEDAGCTVRDNKGYCSCPMGLTGDPHTKCVQKNCTVNEDCDEFLQCQHEKCILRLDVDLYELLTQQYY